MPPGVPVAWRYDVLFHTVSRRGGGGTPVKLPPHWHSPRNHLAGVARDISSSRAIQSKRPALRFQVPDLKGCRFRNRLRTFHLSSSMAVAKVEFLETRASQSRSGKSIRHQNRPPGKEARPTTRPGRGEVAQRSVAPGEQVRGKVFVWGIQGRLFVSARVGQRVKLRRAQGDRRPVVVAAVFLYCYTRKTGRLTLLIIHQ